MEDQKLRLRYPGCRRKFLARIEAGAVRANHYFSDVVDYYRSTAGELTVACVDGVPVGMGKLTVLFDGSAWLELLRVHPDFQRKGVGRAIYRRYFEEIRALGQRDRSRTVKSNR